MTITLNQLDVGQSATVEVVGGSGALRQHFLDMGLIPQATVTLIKRAPMGDPIEVRIRSYELTLRVAEADRKSTRLNSSHKTESRMPSSA